MDYETFKDGMKLLAAAWPDRSPGETTMAAYWLALADLSDDVWMAAVGRCLRGSRFFPAPAELREAAEEVLASAGMLPPDAEEAWRDVLNCARRYVPGPGPEGTPWNFTPDVQRALDDLGGLRTIAMSDDGEVSWLRKQFLDRYRIYRRRRIDDSPDLMAQSLPAGDVAQAGAVPRQLREVGS